MKYNWSKREVSMSKKVGIFLVEYLEGPTDNPIRITVMGTEETSTFLIEGTAWKLLGNCNDENVILHVFSKFNSET